MTGRPYARHVKQIGKPAVVAAIIGPIQSVLGWVLSATLVPGYDPLRLTISDLAAPGSPAQILQSSFFILGGTLTLIAAIYARTFALAGRVALAVSALCTYGLTIFPTSLTGHAPIHTTFAAASFVLSAGWLLLAIRTRADAPFIIRPKWAIWQTAYQAAVAIIFLVVWADVNSPVAGLWERVVTTSQSLQASVVILVIYRLQRSQSTKLKA